jgi:predicted dehydrogenase
MLNIGVLGAGHLGKIHLRLLKEIPAFKIAGFYDRSAETRMQVSAEFGIPAFESMEDLIGHVEVVDVVTPTLSHFECAAYALKN